MTSDSVPDAVPVVPVPVPVPVLEIGGTHVTAALVDPLRWEITGPDPARFELPATGSADDLLSRLCAAVDAVPEAPAQPWGVAVPGPFDYAAGVALFAGVGKFESLYGVDLGAELTARRPGRVSGVTFCNDADAFLLGEWSGTPLGKHARCVAITLGTGVGSAFLRDGAIVHDGPGVAPDGEVHLLTLDGVPLEDRVSQRAIRRAYAQRSGRDDHPDVREIAELARGGDAVAARTLTEAYRGLGRVLGPLLARFGATALVVGGSIARSWDLIEQPLRDGLGQLPLEFVVSPSPDRSALVGAARTVWNARADVSG